MKKHVPHLVAAAVSTLVCASPATFAKSLTESLQTGSVVKVNFRTRFEDVSEDGLTDSSALTTRSRLSYQSGSWNGLGFTAEFDDVTEWNSVDYRAYPGDTSNPGTAVIADPEGTEVNQGFISYTDFNNQAKLGRQRLILDNARFVGNVGWRQNEQTYDGFSYTNKSVRYTNFTYAYIRNVNRIFGDVAAQPDHEMNSHILNVSYTGLDAGKLVGYAYLLDNKTAPALSSDTYGVRFQSAAFGNFSFNLEYAKQTNAGANEAFDADYLLAEAILNVSVVKATLGYEVLGSDGGAYGFATPLATAHAFQGWADKFLNTPAMGIKDKYLNLGTKLVGADLLLSYHQFDSDEGSLDYGSEVDFAATRKIGPAVWTLKYANYSMGDVASVKDTQKFWLMMDWSF